MLENMIGQARAVGRLAADLETGRRASSYLFTGPAGVGKRTAAVEFAKALNCQRGRRESLIPDRMTAPYPCGHCASCRKIGEGNHPDVFILDFDSQARLLELDPDEAEKQKEYRIDSLRILSGRSYVSPLEADKKVFIVDGAELLSPDAANSLLKTLEETPRGTCWILISVSQERVFPTVRSRCRKIPFGTLEPGEIGRILKNAGKEEAFAKDALDRAARASGGSAARALAWLEPGSDDLLAMARQALGAGRKLPDALALSASVLGGRKSGAARRRAEEFIAALAHAAWEERGADPTGERAGRLDRVLEYGQRLKRNASPQMTLDALLAGLR